MSRLTLFCHWYVISTLYLQELESFYNAFQKYANSEVQKPPSYSLPSIIIMITSNEPWKTETHKMDQTPPITNHKRWPFELVKETFYFLRRPLRWLTAAKTQTSVGFWTSVIIRVSWRIELVKMDQVTRKRLSQWQTLRLRTDFDLCTGILKFIRINKRF